MGTRNKVIFPLLVVLMTISFFFTLIVILI